MDDNIKLKSLLNSTWWSQKVAIIDYRINTEQMKIKDIKNVAAFYGIVEDVYDDNLLDDFEIEGIGVISSTLIIKAFLTEDKSNESN